MLKAFSKVVQVDLTTRRRQKAKWAEPGYFLVLFVLLFNLLGDTDLRHLLTVCWVGLFVTTLLAIESALKQAYEQGVYGHFRLSPYPLWWLLLAQGTALWLGTFLPLIVLCPLVGWLLGFDMGQIALMAISLLAASPAIVLIGMLAGLLTLSLPSAGLFMGLLILPLYLPLVILGHSAIVRPLAHIMPWFELSLLLAISLLVIITLPHALAAALRIGQQP